MGLARAAQLAASGTIVCALLAPGPALATTGVSGASSPTAPLVIDPKTLPTDPLTLRLDTGMTAQVAYVQRMPVTKTIEKVTIGDFEADPSGCSAPPQLRVVVAEHPAGNADVLETLAFSEVNPQPPASSGPVTWSLNHEITLRAGHGYSFHVRSLGCRWVYQTTWAHNYPQVNGGSVPCAGGPYIGESPGRYLKRGFHAAGQADAVYGPQGCAGAAFEPVMPGGWLVGVPVASGFNIATSWRVDDGEPPPSPCFAGAGTNVEDYGGEIVDWTAEKNDGNINFLCRWTQFGGLGEELTDGWYYGLPWRTERNGRPRDVYLKVGEDTTPPAVKFRPILRFDSAEKWRPLNIDALFAEGTHRVCLPRPPFTRQLAASAFRARRTALFEYMTDCEVITDPAELTSPPWNSASAWIQVAGQGLNASTYHSADPTCVGAGILDCGLAPESTVYYQETERAGGYRYLDYWAFYRYSDGPISGVKHQADWEGVTVGLPSAAAPTFHFASFAQHGNVYSYLRENLRCDGGAPGSCGTASDPVGERLNVFVVNGGHAAYPQPCRATVVFGFQLSCWQTGYPQDIPVSREAPLPDAGGWDGEVPWAANSDPTAVLPFPAPKEERWTGWDGSWGVDGPVPSPGDQIRFRNPGVSTTTCNTGEGNRPNPTAVCSARRRQTSCDSWFGQSVSVAVCEPRQLRRAVQRRRLGKRGETRVVFTHRSVQTASGPGVTQAMGIAVTPRDETHVRGLVRRGSTVLVRGYGRARLLTARFELKRSLKNPAIQVRWSRRGARVRLTTRRALVKPRTIQVTRVERQSRGSQSK